LDGGVIHSFASIICRCHRQRRDCTNFPRLSQGKKLREEVGEANACVKEGADKVLVWLGHVGLAVKKLNILMRLGDDGTLCSGIMEFSAKQSPNDKTFLPIHQ